MTDESNIILHWEINNAAATLAMGKAESGVFNEGGFSWIATVQKSPLWDAIYFTLRCDSDHNEQWKCEGGLKAYMLNRSGTYNHLFNDSFCFENINNTISNCKHPWFLLVSPVFNINDKVTMEFRINITSSENGHFFADPAKFAAPNNKSNVILRIGDEKLYVWKELLAFHSPVFDTLFFGDFAEKGKEEVELKDVVYEEFLDLVHLIYLEPVEITDRSVVHILKLADQFQMERLLTLSKKHLIQSKGLDVMKKLLLADQYRLTSLKDHCINSFTSSNDLTAKLKSSPEFDNFSSDMQAAICKRIVKLT